tara:strand:+ start:771 stop:1382 length:612 start_codon:yes stop_codon:yes gene_type:complete
LVANAICIEYLKSIINFLTTIINEGLPRIHHEINEKLTVHHDGDKIRVEDGLNKDEVDFVLKLDLTGIENLVKYTEDGKIDDTEATIIARVFFTPFTRETMKNPVMAENRKRKAEVIEDLIHAYLNFPDGKPAASQTLIYAADQWVIVDGIVGNPKRVFKLTHQPALDYQRHVFEAIETDTKKGWLSFVKWYKVWRKDYSTES